MLLYTGDEMAIRHARGHDLKQALHNAARDRLKTKVDVRFLADAPHNALQDWTFLATHACRLPAGYCRKSLRRTIEARLNA